jgi:membrane dipeptidase
MIKIEIRRLPMKRRISLLGVFGLLVSMAILATSCSASKVQLDEKSLEAKAKTIHSRILSVDTHCDTPSRMTTGTYDVGERHDPAKTGNYKIDLPRMVEGRLDALFFGVFVGQGALTPEAYQKAKERALQELDAIDKMCQKYPNLVGPATTPADAYRLKKEGRRIAFIGMENGYPIGRDLSLLKAFYDRGVRYVTLCHSADNDICDSSTGNPEDRGLSDFGRQVVAECNRLGIMVDVSHMSDKSFADVVRATKAPIFASHSCCRALCDSPRNLTDDMLRALAKNGGVLQMCILSGYLKAPRPNPEREKALKELEAKYGPRRNLRNVQDEALRKKAMQEYQELMQKFPPDPQDRATVKDVVDHIDHVVKVVGIDYVGIGTDFDGGGGVIGCDDVSEMFHLTMELLRRGYSEKEIRKIWGGNIMRALQEVIDVSNKAEVVK